MTPDVARPLRRSRTLQVLGLLVALGILAYVVRGALRDWQAVRAYAWSWRPAHALASLLVIQIGFLLMARSWRSILRAIGVRLHLSSAYWIFYLSNLGRYVPGKVWQMGAAAVMGRRFGISAADTVASMVVHLLYFLPLGAALALSSGHFPAPFDGMALRIAVWCAALALAAFALWPHAALRLWPGLARRLQLDPERWRLATSRRLGIVIQTLAAWACLSGGFALLVWAITDGEVASLWVLSQVYIASHILGYVVLIAPAGLGVREGVIVVIMTPYMGAGPAAGIALFSRLWFTLAELLTVGVAFGLLRRERQSDRGPEGATEADPGSRVKD